MSNQQKNKIEKKAYELFMSRGCQHGNDLGDWLTAEKEVLGGSSSKSKTRTKRTKK
ncbi:MAG: DUF2934 domain-containing protein [Spirochaetales bacterium]|nr:DUF2934 domain-containing protein [Spirochaetales bacterium]